MVTSIEDLTARAKALIAERKYQEAVRACRRVLLSRPEMVEVRLLLGMALLALRREEEARAEMMAVLRAMPDHAPAHRLLGEAYLRAGQADKARQSIERALELEPGDREARQLLQEVASDPAPVMPTIDRWFDPQAVATVRTDAPPHVEEATRQLEVPEQAFGDIPSVEVDPGLLRKEPAPRRPGPDPDSGVIASPLQPRGPRSAIPPPPRSVPPAGAAGPPRKSSMPPPSSAAGFSPQLPPPPRAPRGPDPSVFEVDTRAHSPGALRAAGGPPDPFDHGAAGLSELDRVALGTRPVRAPHGHDEDRTRARSVEDLPRRRAGQDSELDGEPTRMRPPRSDHPPPFDRPPPSSRPAPHFEAAEDERTHTHRSPSYAPPPLGRPDHGSPYGEAHRYGHGQPPPYGEPGYGGPPYGDPEHGEPIYGAPGHGDPGHGAPPYGDPAGDLPPYGPPPDYPPDYPPYGAPPAGQPHAGGPPGAGPFAPSPFEGPAAQRPPGPAGAQLPVPTATRPREVPARARSLSTTLAMILVPGLLVGVGLLVYVLLSDGGAGDAVAAAAERASDDGLRSSLDEALELVGEVGDEDGERAALRARLLATLVLEHGAAHEPQVDEALAIADRTGEGASDAAIARAYVALSRGDVASAQAALGRPATEGGAELSRARALTALASGDSERALAAAAAAAQERPASPRHVSLHALAMAARGDVAAARGTLDGVPEGQSSPWVRVARARVLLEGGGDPVSAAAEADAVTGTLADRASPIHAAWAHLVRAQVALAAADLGKADEEARAAVAARPRGDEAFGLRLADALLQAGDPAAARDVLGTLPTESRDSARRQALVAEVALESDDLDAAAVALRDAGDSAHVLYLRGRVAEARGRDDEARALYEQAARDRNELVRARARLGGMELRAGRSERAIELFEEVVDRQPADLDVVPLYVRALLRLGQTDRAATVVGTALNLRPGAPTLVAVRAEVALARGEVREALAALREVVGMRPEDPDLQVALGQAALRAGEAQAAQAAFARALELRPGLGSALEGQAELAFAGGELAAAEAAVERAREAGAAGPRLDALAARVQVMAGAGEAAIATLTPLAEAADTPELWVALGQAQRQAERDDHARRSFDRALRADPNNPEAHLGLSFLDVRRVRITEAVDHMNAAHEHGESRGLGAPFAARVLAVRARLVFEQGRFGTARQRAQEALELDARCAEAHLVMANLAEEEGADPVPHFRAAVEAPMTPPEAIGRLALKTTGDEACELARRYLRAAPRGYDASDVRRLASRCR